jgi:hypothetical protein
MEAKPLASLSSGLLARKGAARPAMRRPMAVNSSSAAALAQDDLGWNDMGYDVNPDPSTPMDYEHDSRFNPLANAVPEVKPEVKLQQDRIAQQLNIQAEELQEQIDQAEQFAEAEPIVEIALVAIAPEPAPMPVPLPTPAPAPLAPPKVMQLAPKAEALKPRAAAGQKAKSAFTLRLDQDRHLKLRLACAVSHCSAQQLVTAALDAFIEAMPEVNQLASQLPTKNQCQSV